MSNSVSNLHLINCDEFPKRPFTPDGWKIVSHQEMKGFLDLRKILLVPAEKVWSHMFEGLGRYEINGKKYIPLNACVLDYFRENSKCTPDGWKKVGNSVRHIFFPGTTYYLQSSREDYTIRYFYLEGGVPGWFWRSAKSKPESNHYVALIAI